MSIFSGDHHHLSLPTFSYKSFETFKKLKEEYVAHLYTFHLNPTVVNILPYLCVLHIDRKLQMF